MSDAFEQLMHEALELPVQERAKLAHFLITSIDDFNESEITPTLDTELQMRVKEIREGKVTGTPAEEVFTKLLERSN
jgi:putative addiction module component (TIGR02574 family)